MPRFFRLAEEHYYQHGYCHRAPQCPWHLVSTPKALRQAAAEQWAILSGWYPLLQQLFAKRFEISKFCMNPIDSNGTTSYEILRQVATSRWRANSSYLGTVSGQSRERYNKMEQDATNWDNQHHFCFNFCCRKCFRYLEINHITDLDRYITQYPPQRDRNVIKSFTVIFVARYFSVFYGFLHIFCNRSQTEVKQNSLNFGRFRLTEWDIIINHH